MKENFNNPAHSKAKTRGAFLPLPEGEGRGEGKVIIQPFERGQCKMSVTFPLILTFSLREKEQQLDISPFAGTNCAADHVQFANPLRTSFPLPAGEGQGEGERSAGQTSLIPFRPTFNPRATP